MNTNGDLYMYPRVIASSGEFRLVQSFRDSKSWPDMSDVVLERRSVDAMAEVRWDRVDSWVVGPPDPQRAKVSDTTGLVLWLLVGKKQS